MVTIIVIYSAMIILNFLGMYFADSKNAYTSFMMSILWPISIIVKILTVFWKIK